ncbi:MAG: hypothetical protein JWP03_2618 [Phycisphaerales bacterium]|jgi:hypothetical protein|nr:hypothetical protein [Phycisphaerales bacterium]
MPASKGGFQSHLHGTNIVIEVITVRLRASNSKRRQIDFFMIVYSRGMDAAPMYRRIGGTNTGQAESATRGSENAL